ncbi:hypothetical protein NDU88_003627 [Pleurodeles waltl]|uniref:Uncharacterized protein n=1 Tax=Pleurodeles waltl TaxID=8319 RepID=A0AAV7KX14_PLEWA|nr:hypothetical protein NDU88_003627 [Pleurodeles waltl]
MAATSCHIVNEGSRLDCPTPWKDDRSNKKEELVQTGGGGGEKRIVEREEVCLKQSRQQDDWNPKVQSEEEPHKKERTPAEPQRRIAAEKRHEPTGTVERHLEKNRKETSLVPSRTPPRGSRRSRRPAGTGWIEECSTQVAGSRRDRGPPSSTAPGAPAGPAMLEQLRSGRRAALTSAPAPRPPGRGSPRSPAPSGLPRAPPGKRRALTAQGRSRPESPGNRLTSRDRWCRHCGPPAPPPASRR